VQTCMIDIGGGGGGGRGVEVESNALISLVFLGVKTSSILAFLNLRCNHFNAYQSKCN
jgi:hypothetical protein